MEPTSLPTAPPAEATAAEADVVGKLSGTRRQFIRGIAATGASTAAVTALEGAGAASLFAATAGATTPARFSDFNAVAASSADQFEVPDGFRADVLISWGDTFADDEGNEYEYGFNNDFLAYFPLKGSREGIIFVNHEYAGPFYFYGFKPDAAGIAAGKTQAQVEQERASVGNSILHVRRNRFGVWEIVSPSPYNRRIYGGVVPGAAKSEASVFDVTGPLKGDAKVGDTIKGSIGNCSGGITPWGTALSCEENFDGYGLPLTDGLDFAYGWPDEGGYDDYLPGEPYRKGGKAEFAKYGWVCEHDPYDPSFTPRKHTALGRFRHENTAFRAKAGKKFVLYMGDDKANEGVYKFVSDLEYKPRSRSNNLEILTSGTLYIARWEPEGRRRFATSGDTSPLSATSGTGTWVKVEESELVDTATKLRERFAAEVEPGVKEFDKYFATNRPEDVEVHPDGSVYVAFTNNSSVRDVHGAVRRLVEDGDDPQASSFTWEDFAEGGPTGRAGTGEQGFSACDNLVFDGDDNLWVVTDISSGTLNDPGPLQYHANNALFYVPASGPNAGVAFRFANMPGESEGTGPYFTPDESALFVNVQHPGETAGEKGSPAVFGKPDTYPSYWPEGNKTKNLNPAVPRPSTVVITKGVEAPAGANVIPRPDDAQKPKVQVGVDDSISVRRFVKKGLVVAVRVDEPAEVLVQLVAKLPGWKGGKKRLRLVARARGFATKGKQAEIVLRPTPRARVLLWLVDRVKGTLVVTVRDEAGNRTRVTEKVLVGG